ncbi:MAG: BMP family ABC transporter substrate-binding protein [Gemmiger sp.]|nr:BMP family ABC transporter substrate-binding protein [Gemmiger sp.]
MKKWISWMLAGALALGLGGCATTKTPAADAPQPLLVDDSAYTLLPADVATPVAGAGREIALVVDSNGLADGANNAAIWSGVQKFCENFGFIAKSYVAADDTPQAAEDALRTAAESSADMVVCIGAALETPLYNLQNNYPTTHYLMLDGEPHTEDYSSYTQSSAVHCVLFREEQAGYLAGYAAAAEGYTSIGFVGAEAVPDIVQYGAGFLQGAEAAAERSGAQVSVKYWYADTYQANDEIFTRVSGWYAENTQLVFACGGTLAESCADAAEQNGGRVAAAGYNQAGLSGTVLTSAIKCVSRTVQNQLYTFYAGGGTWSADAAGKTEQVGVSTQAVALPTTPWGFLNFTTEDYTTLYGKLRDATLKAERYSDSATMPETQNLTVEYQS